MALTPEKREALMLARERIAMRKNEFICHALDHVKGTRPELKAACISLKRYIGRKLSPARALGVWQSNNGIVGRDYTQRCLDRLAWIDWMLDEPKEAHRGDRAA
ncbi:hypothetical protein [Burkholderia phage CSP3]|nr:hypothetical protein [Burkholderia phage CSP3]